MINIYIYITADEPPSHIKTPAEPIACECDDHLDRLETELEFPISAKRLYDIMFSDEANASPSEGGVWLGKTNGTEGHGKLREKKSVLIIPLLSILFLTNYCI